MKRKRQEIWIYNDGEYEREVIAAEKWMRMIYENPVGRVSLLYLITRKAVSRLYGRYCRTRHSAKSIPGFIRDYNVDMTGCKESYGCFAEFFTREKSDIQFPEAAGEFGSPCDGLVSVYTDIAPDGLFAAKDSTFSLTELFQDEVLAESYREGILVRIRLTPANYHRMHFFDDGVVAETKAINGSLYSVNPLAVSRVARLYCRNKRALIKFSSENFGDVVMVEVGATFVGSIVHCFDNGNQVRRDQQASYFMPGGSLVLLFFKKGAITPDKSLLEQTASGYETKVRVGMPLGHTTMIV